MRAPRRPGRRGLLERVLFSFMGPPQLGDPSAPPTYRPDPSAALCPTCGQAWHRHTTVRTSSRAYLTCPDGVSSAGTAAP